MKKTFWLGIDGISQKSCAFILIYEKVYKCKVVNHPMAFGINKGNALVT
jgi:hypothetical protein